MKLILCLTTWKEYIPSLSTSIPLLQSICEDSQYGWPSFSGWFLSWHIYWQHSGQNHWVCLIQTMHSPLAIHVFGLVRIKICVKVQLEFQCSYLQGCVHPSLPYLWANLNAATFFLGKNPRLFPTQSATSDILLNLVHLPELPIGFTCTSLFSICSNTTPKHWQHSTKYNEHLMPCLLHSDNAQDLHVHYRSLLLHGIYVKEHAPQQTWLQQECR